MVIASGFFVWLISWGLHGSFGVFYKPLLDEFGWNRGDAVFAYSLVAIVQAFLAIVMGVLTDRLGPRVVVTVFGSCLGISYILISRIDALWQFQVFYAMSAIGLSTATIPIMATISRWFIKRRRLMTGMVQTGAGFGGFIFAPTAGWLILNYGWRPAYFILGVVALGGIIISGLIIKRDPRDVGQFPDGERDEITQASRGKNTGVQVEGFSLSRAMRTRQFWLAAGVYFSFGFCRSTYLPHIAAHVQDLGFSLTDGARVVAILTVSSVFGRLGMGWLNSRSAFMLSYAMTALSLVWVLMTSDLWGVYLFAVVFGFAWGAQAVLRFTVVAETFGLVSVGLIMGALGFAEASASAFGSYFAGFMFDLTGGYQAAFIAGIVFSVTGVILTSLLRPMVAGGGPHPSSV